MVKRVANSPVPCVRMGEMAVGCFRRLFVPKPAIWQTTAVGSFAIFFIKIYSDYPDDNAYTFEVRRWAYSKR